LEVAGVERPRTIDGSSLVPLLKAGGASSSWRREAIYWHYPHYHPGGATPYSAIRFRDWKLIEFFEDDHIELYNLRQDPLEAHDLAKQESARASDLRKRLHAWRADVGAQAPVKNPDYDPKRERERPAPRRSSL
jgi:arylsulfatase A